MAAMRTIRIACLLYLLVLVIAVSYPLGPPRAPWKRHLLTDSKPAHLVALAQDVGANVALFAPVGFLGRLLLGAGGGAFLIVIAAGAALSLGIETAQHFVLTWRYSTWIDVVSNTAGTALGAGPAGVLALMRRRSLEYGVGC
jgi:glycopeptide antibiotics resistance protein